MVLLPPGPDAGRLLGTVAFHRDPVGTLEAGRAEFGDVWTLRTATGPLVVVTSPDALDVLVHGDPGPMQAGAARRRVLPLVSDRSLFGADGPTHHLARRAFAPAFAPERMAALEPQIAALATEHAARWPRGRPFRLLEAARELASDLMVRVFCDVRDPARAAAIVRAVRGLTRTPGNPPTAVPGRGDGLLGAGVAAAFERRLRSLRTALGAELEARRDRPGGVDPEGTFLDRVVALDPARSIDAMVDELVVVFAAAQEPGGLGLAAVLGRLARDPALAARVAEGGPEDEAWRASLVDESLRLMPPALASLRRLSEPTEVGAVELPAGARTAVPIPLLHRDPGAFPEPGRFRPGRFADAGAARPRELVPFGGGGRSCIAEPFARAELRAAVPAIARAVRLRAAWPGPEKQVVRGTTLVPHRSTPVLAR